MAFIQKTYTFYTPSGTPLKNAEVSVYFSKTSTSARVFDAGQRLRDTAPQLTTDATGYVLMYFDDDDFPSGQTFDIVATPNAQCNPTEDEVHLFSLSLTTNWSEINDDDGTKPEDNADVTGDHGQSVAWLDEAVGTSLPVANTDAKCTDANADETATHGQSVAWLDEAVGTSLPVANTDAKCTDANADQTSTHNQGVSWLNEAVGSSLPVDNTDAKCTDANADETASNNQGVSWLNEAVGSSLPVDNTDAKCTDANADETAVNTALNTTYVNGSETQSSNTYTVEGDLHMMSGTDISFYTGGDVLTGGLYADSYSVLGSTQYIMRLTSTDILEFYAADKIVLRQTILPYASGSYDIGNATYRINDFYVQGINCTYFTSSGDVRGATFYVGGTVGADFSGPITNLTVVKGLVTVAS